MEHNAGVEAVSEPVSQAREATEVACSRADGGLDLDRRHVTLAVFEDEVDLQAVALSEVEQLRGGLRLTEQTP